MECGQCAVAVYRFKDAANNNVRKGDYAMTDPKRSLTTTSGKDDEAEEMDENN